MLKRFYIQQYEDVFYVILFGLAGAVHMQQLNRWLNQNSARYHRVFRSIVRRWVDLELVHKIKISRNYIIYPRGAVYNYFGLCFNGLSTSSRLKQSALLMEKYLDDEQCYRYSPKWLRSRIQKTSAISFLPNGQAHLNVVNHYIQALTPCHWDLTGLNYEAETMRRHVERSISKNHLHRVKNHIANERNLYRYACKNFYISGAKIIANNDTTVFRVYVDYLYTTYIEMDLLIRRIADAYSFFSELLYDANNSSHKAEIILTIYSHQKRDRVFEHKILKRLKQNSEFRTMTEERLKELIRFRFFNSEEKLFSGFPVKDII
jgi:hypothetical protein